MAKLLLVDDDPSVLRALDRQLSRRYEVVTAGSAAEAYAILERDTFDAIVCDLEMPDENGLDLYLKLSRTRPELAHKIVFLTGHLDAPLDRIVRGTDNPRLSKPLDMALLAEAVRSVSPTSRPPPTR